MNKTIINAILKKTAAFGGDHSTVELKRALKGLPHTLAESIVAFANSQGGTILLGVDEKNEVAITGVSDPQAMESRVAHLCSTELYPPIRADISSHDFDGKWVVAVVIPGIERSLQPAHILHRGIYNGSYIRIADGDRKMTEYEANLLLANRSQPREDAKPVTTATKNDLDQELLRTYLQRIRTKGLRAFRDKTDDEILLLSNVLTLDNEKMKPTIAGLLAFGSYPQHFFPQLNLTFVVYPEESEILEGNRFIDNAAIDGPLVEIVPLLLEKFRRHVKRKALIVNSLRYDEWEYPETAIREAVVNALAHRDLSYYATGTPVQVEMYPNRFIIRNPGGLFGPLNIDELCTNRVTSTRNPILLKILEDVHMPQGGAICESRGSGISLMRQAMNALQLPEPVFHDSISTFEVTFYNKTFNRVKQSPEAADSIAQSEHNFDRETQLIYSAITTSGITRKQLEEITGYAHHIITRRLNLLKEKDLVTVEGKLRSPNVLWKKVEN